MALLVIIIVALRSGVDFTALEWIAIVGVQFFVWFGRANWGGRVVRRLNRIETRLGLPKDLSKTGDS